MKLKNPFGPLFFLLLLSPLLSAAPRYGESIPVTIQGLVFDAMEPFLSADGGTLFFNSLNDGNTTSLYYATRVNDSSFQFAGPVNGCNQTDTPRMDAVASMDSIGRFAWMSTRDYPADYHNLFTGQYSAGQVTGVRRIQGDIYIEQPGWLVMDAALSRNGNELFFCNAYFSGSGIPAYSVIGHALRVNDSTFNRSATSDSLLKNVNDTAFLVYAPELSTDGLELTFTRILRCRPLSSQICLSTRNSLSAPFGIPRILVSSESIPEAATFSNDKARLYFHMKSGGRYGIFLKYRINDADAEKRSFTMGFSPWPYEATLSGIDWIWNSIREHGDIISQHIEEGVPWGECLNGLPFPATFTAKNRDRLARAVGKQQVVQINALNMGRNGLALYRNQAESQPLPFPWNSYAFDSAPVMTAYLNYALRMVDTLQPDYLLLGVEVNLLIRNNPASWPAYVRLIRNTCQEVKRLHPLLPVGVSLFCTPFFPAWSPEDTLSKQLSGMADLDSIVDFYAFSLHPFISGLLCESFPSNYLERLFSLTAKPVAVSESSYPAQTFTDPAIAYPFNGTPQKQHDFLDQMLTTAQNHRALFAIWYAVRDYDTLWHNTLADSPDALLWRDTGLFDEAGNPRPALALWDSCFAFPVSAVENRTVSALFQAPASVRVYPQPSQGSFNIALNAPAQPVISLYNIKGQRVYRKNFSRGTAFNVPVASLPSGIYLLSVKHSRSVHRLKITVLGK